MSTTLTSGSGVRAPGAADRPPPGPALLPLRRRRSIAAWGMAAPFVLLFLVFTAWPVLSSLFMSVTDIKSRDLQNPFAVNFVGLENFATVLSDPTFQKAATNTLYFVVVGVPLTMLTALPSRSP